ncbi:MAG: prepilin-type N-terminal cleavage/methylation domain-containing protein [Dehalococcoidales bacterium]|nr:prepilin-type N-terminal cleavage/methylation domain-containing protein [Dehalococcoidales bacterium]
MDFLKLNKKQCGFSLIEITVALAITGMLGVGIFTGLFQIRRVNDIDNARMNAVKQVESALYYINRDVQSAQTITPGEVSGFPLTLSWTEWEPPNEVEIVYELVNRPATGFYDLYRNGELVAKHISNDTDDTSCSFSPSNHRLTITITSVFPSGSKEASETRRIEIIPRPGS